MRNLEVYTCLKIYLAHRYYYKFSEGKKKGIRKKQKAPRCQGDRLEDGAESQGHSRQIRTAPIVRGWRKRRQDMDSFFQILPN